jgi:hypothetical protein
VGDLFTPAIALGNFSFTIRDYRLTYFASEAVKVIINHEKGALLFL